MSKNKQHKGGNGVEGAAENQNDEVNEAGQENESTEGTDALSENPEGTQYAPDGTALPENYGLINLPTPAAGQEYNSDGTLFLPPADAAKIIGQYKADIAALRLAITKGETMIGSLNTSKELMPKDSRHLFDAPIAAQQTGIDSNKALLIEIQSKLTDFELLLEKPSVREAKRELISVRAKIKELQQREAELVVLTKSTSAPDVKKDEGTKDRHVVPTGTDEQKKNMADALALYETQGGVIVAHVKLGWKNNKIASHFGIADANVPGPKNKFLRSPEGLAFQQANPGLVDSIGK